MVFCVFFEIAKWRLCVLFAGRILFLRLLFYTGCRVPPFLWKSLGRVHVAEKRFPIGENIVIFTFYVIRSTASPVNIFAIGVEKLLMMIAMILMMMMTIIFWCLMEDGWMDGGWRCVEQQRSTAPGKNKQILTLSDWHHDLQDLPQLLWSDKHWLCQLSKCEDTPSTSQVDEEGHEEVGVHCSWTTWTPWPGMGPTRSGSLGTTLSSPSPPSSSHISATSQPPLDLYYTNLWQPPTFVADLSQVLS